MKNSGNYKATGIGGVLCARHCLVRRNGLGDLQKGERYLNRFFVILVLNPVRYANMDFIVLSSMSGSQVPLLTLSYDIACQWSRNIKKRMSQLPSFMQLSPETLESIRFVIPKFHIYGHGKPCQIKYSLNFLKHSGRTDGEEPERWWAHINPVCMSTREMSAGARKDTLDDHASSWNWHKITDLGRLFFHGLEMLIQSFSGLSLAKRLKTAREMSDKHKNILTQFSERFQPETIERWTQMITDWDNDISQPNPYEESVASKCSHIVLKDKLRV